MGVFARHEGEELARTIFGVETSDDFGITFDDIERCAIAFGKNRREEKQETDGLSDDAPGMFGLPGDDGGQIKAAHQQDHAQGAEAHAHLVGNHHRRGTHAAQKTELGVRGPAAQDYAVDAQ